MGSTRHTLSLLTPVTPKAVPFFLERPGRWLSTKAPIHSWPPNWTDFLRASWEYPKEQNAGVN